MNCKTCQYRLWNLTTRRCPECGTPFLPSEHEFAANSVQFCCPHCGQAYYGTGPKGHLVPSDFNCVSCGRPVRMDDMVLRPTAGLDEEQTRVQVVPWLERGQRGFLRCWWRTIGMALTAPLRLMRALPPASSLTGAWWFAILTNLIVLCVAMSPFMLLSLIPRFGVPLEMIAVAAVMVCVGIAILIAFIAFWGLTAHAILAVTGPTSHGLARTYQAICFSSGANAVSAVPCIGPYVGWIWWAISAVLMIMEAQSVRAARAALAALAWPLVFIALLISLYTWSILSWSPPGAPRVPTTNPVAVPAETRTVVDGLLAYAQANAGRGPQHAIELVATGHLATSAFVSSPTATYEVDVPVGATNLDVLFAAAPSELRRATQAAISRLPSDVVAHRLGDFVFTYHGIDFNQADPGLWIVIWSPDPDANPPGSSTAAPQFTLFENEDPGAPMLPAHDVLGLTPNLASSHTIATMALAAMAARLDGSLMALSPNMTAKLLEEQNELRLSAGLEPLPLPSQVTHDRPARANP
jgi:hypothetical protein